MSEIEKKIAELSKNTNQKVEYTLNKQKDCVVELKGTFKLDKPIDDDKNGFDICRKWFSENQALFGYIKGEDLENGKYSKDSKGGLHFSFSQTFDGVLVEGSQISFHIQNTRELIRVKSNLECKIDISVKPQIELKQAESITLKSSGEDAKLIHDEKNQPSLVIINSKHTNRIANDNNELLLCWKIHVENVTSRNPGVWVKYIDATSGEAVLKISLLQNGTGTGYYSNSGPVNSIFSGGVYLLKDTTDSTHISIFDDHHTTSFSTSLCQDPDDIWDLPTSPRWENIRPCVDVIRYMRLIVDYFKIFGWNSFDNTNSEVKCHLHNYGNGLPNNAFWHSYLELFAFGDGNGTNFDYLSSFDIVAHEFTHGVTSHTCNLLYQNESGALNEAFSDMFAALAGYYYGISVDPLAWYIGERTYLQSTKPNDELRRLDKPAEAQQTSLGLYPDHYSNKYTGSQDYGGVHINCTIIGHAIYLMILGGTNPTSSIHVDGIGAEPVEELLHYVQRTAGVLNTTSDFMDFRHEMISACKYLFPDRLDYLTTVKKAFKAVGIGPDVYLRDTTTDTGDEPYSTVSCMSPDIISRKTQILPTGISDLSQGNLSENLELGSTNYVYFRILNGGSHDANNVKIKLYLAKAGTFSNPSLWHYMGEYIIPDTIPAGSCWIPNANNECLNISVDSTNFQVGHFCFIAVIDYDQDPATSHTYIDNYTEFAEYIQKSNNYAWRNVIIEDVYPLTINPRKYKPVILDFWVGKLDKDQNKVDIELDALRIPPGYNIQLVLPKQEMKMLNLYEVKLANPRQFVNENMLPPNRKECVEIRQTMKSVILSENEYKSAEGFDGNQFIRLRVTPKTMLRIRNLDIGKKNELKISFIVNIPDNANEKTLWLCARQTKNDESIGQMNYLIRVHNKQK